MYKCKKVQSFKLESTFLNNSPKIDWCLKKITTENCSPSYAFCADLLQSYVHMSVRAAAKIIEQAEHIDELQSQLTAERTRHAGLKRSLATLFDAIREFDADMAMVIDRGMELWHAKTELERAVQERDREIERLKAENVPERNKRQKVKQERDV